MCVDADVDGDFGGGVVYARCNRVGAQVAWEDRVPTAIFRGNSTGPGVDESNNQRIKLALISKMWKADARYNDRNPVMRMPHLLGSLLHLNSVGSVWPVCLPAIMSCLSCPGGSHPVSGRGCRRVERSRSQNPGLSDDVHQPQGTVWLCVRLV